MRVATRGRRRAATGVVAVLLGTLLTVAAPASGQVATAPGTAALPPGEIVPSAPSFGWTDGDFSVSDDGAARYTIPLWMPEGRGAVRPALALAYDSRGGNGPLGVGWSLRGLSTIAPCPRTPAQDGVIGGVAYDATDVYCVAGNRLRPVGPHANGQREYRTEQDTVARVIAFGAADRVPDFFRMWTRDGRILTFGETEASRLRAYRLTAGSTVDPPTLERSATPHTVAWPLNRIEDRTGNVATIGYTNSGLGDQGNLWGVEMRPASITYGPNRRIDFEYQERGDPVDRFSGGVHVRTVSRLRAITMSAGPEGDPRAPVRTYVMGYHEDGYSITGRSLLETVTECDGGGVCLRPVHFSWSSGGTELDPVDTLITDAGNLLDGYRLVPGDVTGDGKDDLLYLDSCAQGCNRWSLRRNTGTGANTFGAKELANLPRAKPDDDYRSDIRPVDVDHDGRLDLMAEVDPSGGQGLNQFVLYRSTGTAFTEYAPFRGAGRHVSVGPNLPYFVDLDGSGNPDFVVPAAETPSQVELTYGLHTGTQVGQRVDTGLRAPRASTTRIRVLDADGDGRAGLLVGDATVSPHRYHLFGLDVQGGPTLVPAAQARVNIPYPAHSDPRDLQLADVNGDGLDDAVYPLSGLRVQLNTGRGFSPYLPGPANYHVRAGNSDTDPGVRILDYNNDGRDDVMVLLPGQPTGDTDRERGIQLWTWRDGPTLAESRFEPVPINRSAGTYFNDVGMTGTQPLDVDGNDVLDLVQIQPTGQPGQHRVTILKRRDGTKPDQILGAAVAGGPAVQVEYRTLANRTVHEPATCTYPLACPAKGGSVVWRHLIADGIGGSRTFTHFYREARADLTGVGWLGFAAHRVTDTDTGATVETTFDNTTRNAGTPTVYPHALRPEQVRATVVDTARAHRRTVTHVRTLRRLAVPGTYSVDVTSLHDQEDERPLASPDWTVMRAVVELILDRDDFGNPTSVVTSTGEGRNLTENLVYDNDTTSWLIGKLRRRTTTGCTFAGECDTRRTAFTYRPDGLLRDSVVEPDRPDRPDLWLQTVLDYGAFGTLEKITMSDRTGAVRTESLGYDGDRLYPTVFTNGLGHADRQTVHSGLGVVLDSTDANGVLTTRSYDGFGRLRRTNHADGRVERIAHLFLFGDLISTTGGDGSQTITGLDQLGRVRVQQVEAFDGRLSTVETTYDRFGRVQTVSRPYLPDETPRLTTFTYDKLDRPLTIAEPTATVRHEYLGRETHTFDADGTHSYVVRNTDGDVESSFEDDPNAATWLRTGFEYGPFGQLTRIEAADGTVQTMQHDILGRQFELVDPSAGTTTTGYNAFGEPTTRTDAAGTTTLRYDPLGRVDRVTSADGEATNTWDTAEHGRGRLASARSADGVTTRNTYDDVGHLASTTWDVDGTGYEFGYGYDTLGRLSTVTYPQVPGTQPEQEPRLTVRYGYNEHGYLSEVRDAAAPPTAAAYWTALSQTAAGQTHQERYGNGVTSTNTYKATNGLLERIEVTGPGTVGVLRDVRYGYDLDSNVDVRNDIVNGRVESYAHDPLNRLTGWTLTRTGAPVRSTTYTYDRVGNLRTETVAGQPDQNVSYSYGQNGAPPHALTARNSAAYRHDGAGREVVGPQRTVSYTADNQPRTVTWGQGKRTDYRYDASGSRVHKVDNDQIIVTVGGLFERRTPTRENEVQNLHTIVADGRVVAQVIKVQATTGGQVIRTQVHTVHTDLQGSTMLVTNQAGKPSGGDGTFLAQLFYHPFGQRVEPDGTPLGTGRHGGPRQGYGGHEHDDEYGLVNMGGRTYDPEARRFLTPDPVLTRPLSSQSHNRYAYVGNNPTTVVDPSGMAPGIVTITCTSENPEFCGGVVQAGIGGDGADPFVSGTFVGSGNGPSLGESPSTVDDGQASNAVQRLGQHTDWQPERNLLLDGPDWFLGAVGFAESVLLGGEGPRAQARRESLGPDQGIMREIVENGWGCTACHLSNYVWGLYGPAGFNPDNNLPYDWTLDREGLANWVQTSSQARFFVEGMTQIATARINLLRPPGPALGQLGGGRPGRAAVKEFDVVPYRPSNPGFENHHGVMDAWASKNVPGYASRSADAPVMVLSPQSHAATEVVRRNWMKQRYGRAVGVRVDWTTVSPREMYRLSEDMFDAARVPQAARDRYYRSLNWYFYMVGD